jgi:hypothetical protein
MNRVVELTFSILNDAYVVMRYLLNLNMRIIERLYFHSHIVDDIKEAKAI